MASHHHKDSTPLTASTLRKASILPLEARKVNTTHRRDSILPLKGSILPKAALLLRRDSMAPLHRVVPRRTDIRLRDNILPHKDTHLKAILRKATLRRDIPLSRGMVHRLAGHQHLRLRATCQGRWHKETPAEKLTFCAKP